ncbi:MAG: biotin synthase BioB [Nitrospiraceae bacterium]|nr:biotin synthase BioB [Nitrospiraceae bacterium]
MLASLTDRIISGGRLTKDEAARLSTLEGPDIFGLFAGANRIRSAFRADIIDLCSIVNAKSGSCPEDCSYCAQSASAKADISRYPLLPEGEILDAARRAKESGAKRFCIVTSGRKPGQKELSDIASAVGAVRKAGLLPCATLGLLDRSDLELLRDAGLERYHHNLETSRRFFPRVCSSHTYDEKLDTISAVKETGLSLCSGGIFGLGEDWEDRIDMALEIERLGADSVPVNFLIPIPGTGLSGRKMLAPLEALKIVSIYRFLLPSREIRICGGRLQCLGSLNPFVFMAGADGLLTGDYLTKQGMPPTADLDLIARYGLRAG